MIDWTVIVFALIITVMFISALLALTIVMSSKNRDCIEQQEYDDLDCVKTLEQANERLKEVREEYSSLKKTG